MQQSQSKSVNKQADTSTAKKKSKDNAINVPQHTLINTSTASNNNNINTNLIDETPALNSPPSSWTDVP